MANLQNNFKSKTVINNQVEYRYERKFVIPNLDSFSVESIIKRNVGFFSEIYHQRYINNVYFDYLDFNNFTDNMVGNMFRSKYRLRWYGDLFSDIENPKLEIKIKKGLVGTKKLFDIAGFRMESGIDAIDIKNAINTSLQDSLLPKLCLQSQQPVMLNRYRRKYFQSCDKKFRITIDDNQSFYKIAKFNNSFMQSVKDYNRVILELKYDRDDDLKASEITRLFPFRLTKSSKYARGITMLYG